MQVRFLRKLILLVVGGLFLLRAAPSPAQVRDPIAEMRARADEEYRQSRIRSFIEDVYRFYEVSGELVSFRVRPDMSASELQMVEDRSKELEDRAGRLISFIEYVIPRVKGNTDDLWVLQPLGENPSLEDRLTLILALVYGVEPKLQHFIELLTEETEQSIEVDDLIVEASLPFLIVGGLEEIQNLVDELRRSLST